MDIRFCAECGEETANAGLALWPGIDEPVVVVECTDPGCGWAGTEAEHWAGTEVKHRAARADTASAA